MNLIQKPLIALALLLLSACGGVADMAYNNAPRLVANEIDDAFDLDKAQNDQLDTRLERFFAWHRTEELARYQQFLDRAALAAADGITATEFLDLHGEIGAAWDRSLEKIIDNLGDLAVDLSPEQIASFEQYHAEGSGEYLKYLDKSEQQREIDRVQRAYDRLESWYGEFDFHLEDRVLARLRDVPDIYLPWFEFREQRHQALMAALRDVPANGFDRQRLRRILLDPTTEHARAFAPARQAYWQAYAAALEDISSWLTEQQRQRAVIKLQKYARVVERLRDEGQG